VCVVPSNLTYSNYKSIIESVSLKQTKPKLTKKMLLEFSQGSSFINLNLKGLF